jgi:predicted site-specific integrase-resolvase
MLCPMENGQRPEGPVNEDEPVALNGNYYSVAVAAAIAGAADETIRAWYDSGELTGHRNSRGHRMIDATSLRRRIASVGVSEAARIAGVSTATIRAWYSAGYVTGYETPAGRRRVNIASIKQYLEDRRR